MSPIHKCHVYIHIPSVSGAEYTTRGLLALCLEHGLGETWYSSSMLVGCQDRLDLGQVPDYI